MTSNCTSERVILSIGIPGDTGTNGSRQRVTLACVRCRTRKIRCDGAEICSKCVAARVPCDYLPVPVNENIAAREKKALAKALRSRSAQPGSQGPEARKPSSKRKLAKSEKMVKRPKQEKKEESCQPLSPLPGSVDAFAEFPLTDGSDYATTPLGFSFASCGMSLCDASETQIYNYSETPTDLGMSPDGGGYFEARYASSSSPNSLDGYSKSFDSISSFSCYPPTPASATFLREQAYNSSQSPSADLQQGESWFHAKDYAHTIARPGPPPSVLRSHSTPQFQPFPFPPETSDTATQFQPSGLCIYISGNHHVHHEAQPYSHQPYECQPQSQQMQQAEAYCPSPMPASKQYPHAQSQPSTSCAYRSKPFHSRTISLPLNQSNFSSLYNGPIDWTRRPLAPFLTTRPGHERTYSEYGTSGSVNTSMVQTVRLDQICKTESHETY